MDHFCDQFSDFFRTEFERVSDEEIKWNEYDVDLLRIEVETSLQEL